ncbi:hypothetical protein DXG03_001269 [Asterophora parasitica]|uniref:JmjC domain-containing protein n=1 Tax=Asterophora parasitica TaxID=117018 RepID=A0A9P7KBN7_9AGAR|nr:hypothetical protein DXG03_001269 [Asterophora parasitica]
MNMQGRPRTMNSIPDLAKKTSINSLLNPEASSDAFNSQIPNPNASLNTHQAQPHAHQVYGASYDTTPSFNLRAASWGGHDDRRKPAENTTRHYAHHHDLDGYAEQAEPRASRVREDAGGYAVDAGMWQAQQEGNYGLPAITPMYSDERTAWQFGERASARIVARGTAPENQRHNGNSYYQSPPAPVYHTQFPPQDPSQQQRQQQQQQQQQPPQQPSQPRPQEPRVVHPPPKRRTPDEEAPPPKAKRAKTASTTKTAASKRGYPAKKRSEAAQVAAQNAKLAPQVSYTTKPAEKGKEKASDCVSMQIVPSDPGKSTLHAELQSTRCDTCRFQGIRFFLRSSNMDIVGVSFSETQKADLPSMKFPKAWNEELTPANIKRTKNTIAKALLPTLRTELAHLKLPMIIHRPREREVRATCDTCMTSIFSSSWLCRLCGREACAECFTTVSELTAGSENASTDPKVLQAIEARREKHAHANPFFLQCTKRIEHQAKDFSPMSRFCEKELSTAIHEMEELLKETDDGVTSSNLREEDNDEEVEAPLPEGFPAFTTANPFIPVNLSHNTLSTPTLPIRRFEDAVLKQENFPRIWGLGEPLVVTSVLDKFDIEWTPEYFISKYGLQSCLIIECQTEVNKRITVGEFFREFGKYEGRGECWKLKDWPPSTDFKKAFPELYLDFSKAAPVPSYVRRDGVLNIASHFPADTVSPDLGPKMYNAMATDQVAGSKGTTRLHMDMADALNIMTYAAPAPDGKAGCAAWDIFRAGDSNKLRDFLKGLPAASIAANGKDGENGAAKTGVIVTDPIHGQQFYLDEELRAKLYEETGVKSYRFYQRPGEAVFIPAGCAHQVANLSDCVKVAVDFVSPENVVRCERLTREFREQNQRKVWKEDVLQLRTMMWFAWLSCRLQVGHEREDGSDSEEF